MSKPVVDVGATISFTWPNGETELSLTAVVRHVEESHKSKNGSKFVYTLECSDESIRKTRLLNLDWSPFSKKHQKKRCHPETKQEGTTSSHHAVGSDLGVAKTANLSSIEEPASKKLRTGSVVPQDAKKARWAKSQDRTIYVKQIPYAAW